MDSVTAAMCKMGTGRVGFARVLVEVSAKKVLPEFIEVVYKNGVNDVVCRKSIKVEYDWVPPRCSICCVYGHTDLQCSKKKECDKPECSSKNSISEETKGNSSNKGGDDEGFIGVGSNKNGGVADKLRKQNFKPNTQLPKQPKQVLNKPKTSNQFVYQQKKPNVHNMQGGSSSGGEDKGKKDSIPSPLKSSPKKAWNVPGEIVDALKKSANKYSVLEEYDVNELGELTEIRNKDIVDEFISQNKNLSENELQKWNFDMIAYYKQKVKQKENNSKMQSSGCGNEVNDVFEDDSGVAQCMESDVLKGLDGGIIHG
ncbi:ATPase, F1/V1/A1 complex, alpha/beta subunit, Zinc knuckle CX2CX4HX4C [Artemisia annua]|uniref:ATPase, F1/V1/A1 complex, alpha/beta subunit, Zinc knuckle CX2CX4HX4C n=1 Tax=Artemisia annua TaxID=35608 RepID=A0A2U1L9B8_ARTAN|nr:ATPase, F1/V1/A1 complex, alpha/beta subunit, Zinc knuckle CX2CX4HX4C [Artemisia annua]